MFVGMDLHKNYLQVAVLDGKGKVLKNSRIDNDLNKIQRFFDRIDTPCTASGSSKDVRVVMESSCVWYNIYEYLSEERKLDVLLSNPFKTRAIASAKIKTDKLDAVKLADLLRGGYIAECYVPDRRIMDLRQLVRHRIALVRMRTKLKNKIHGITLMQGVKITDTSTFSNSYIQKLKQLNDYRIDAYLRLIDSLDSEIKKVSKEIQSRAEKEDMAKLLVTIPGIGYYSALLILSEIGDINRFPDSYHLCSYAGLVPSTHSSGGITYHGAITKFGSKYLRWIMIECVRAHIRLNKDSNITQFYIRLAKRKGNNSKAVVAAASKLLKVVYWVMKEKRKYHA
jgi:transposase